MPMPSQEQHTSLPDRMRVTLHIVAVFSGGLATFAEVTFFRHTFGERYFHGFRPALPLLFIFFFGVFWPGHDLRPLLALIPLYCLMNIRHRFAIGRRRRAGVRGVHSQYNGISRLHAIFRSATEERIKSFHEPAMLALIGTLAAGLSPPLGCFLVLSALGQGVHAGLIFASQRQRELDLHDAVIEGELLTGASREHALTVQSRSTEVVRVHRSIS